MKVFRVHFYGQDSLLILAKDEGCIREMLVFEDEILYMEDITAEYSVIYC